MVTLKYTVMKKLVIILITSLVSYTVFSQKITLVDMGRSKCRIIIPNKPTIIETKAALVLQKYILQISGAKIRIMNDKKNPKSGEILVGNVNRPELKSIVLENFGTDGFIIRNSDKNLVIAGGSEKGVLYGVYTFLEKYLGCKKYTSTVSYIPPQKSIVLNSINDIQIPCFTFRRTSYRDTRDPEFLDWHKLDDDSEWGFWVHTFSRLLSPKEYGESHPEYFSFYDGKRHPESQLCLTNPDVFEIVYKNLQAEIDKKPTALYWSVSQNDNTAYCRCPECIQLGRNYTASYADNPLETLFGGNAYSPSGMGTVLPFINKLAERFPDKVISTLAYQYTRRPPINIIPRKNVNLMLCDIEITRDISMEKGDTAFCNDLAGWANLTDNILVWDYVIQFTNLLAPFPDLRVLQPNIQFLHKNRVTAVYEQGNREIGGEFSELRAYLLAKLLWNPDVDINGVLDDFLIGYYGNAAMMVREYIDLMHNSMEQSGTKLFIFGNPIHAKETFLSDSLVTIYNQIFDRAEEAVSESSERLMRVKSARLPLYYAMLEIAKNEKTGNRGAFILDEQGRLKKNPQIVKILNEFVSHCILTNISHLAEWGITPQEYLETYNKFFEENSGLLSGNKV